MWTRKQYVNGECSHRTYYAQFVNPAVVAMVKRAFTVERLVRCSDQDYFNTIPLHRWDSMAMAAQAQSKQLRKDTGEGLSLTTGVCILKEAARQLVETHHAEQTA